MQYCIYSIKKEIIIFYIVRILVNKLALIIEAKFISYYIITQRMHRSAAVAARGIELAVRDGIFYSGDVGKGLDDPPSQSTITRVLQQLESEGWLERDTSGSSLWRAGTKARILGDMNESTIRLADREPRGSDNPGSQPSSGKSPFNLDF
ncbi:hypothetical protein [Salinibaculum salinum]|uniref:hypothetical protein n=1 Tax=Salinibaculum salinum TaxID=3131996 RepID=UPI0030EDD56A